MLDALELLRERGWQLLPAASSEELLDLEAALGRRLPDRVRALYVVSAGAEAPADQRLRLMPPHEAGAETAMHRHDDFLFDARGDARAVFSREEFALFWSDDDGNYAGVFMDGPLEGMVFVLDHEEPLPVPGWASVDSFLAALAVGEAEGFRLVPRDFPRSSAAPPGPWDALADEFFASYREHGASSTGVRAASCAMALSSPAQDEQVRELLTSTDGWLQDTAVQTLAHRGAIRVDELVEVVRSGGHNARLRAKRLLATTPDDEGLRAVEADEDTYWAAAEARDQHSPLRRVPGLRADERMIRSFRSTLWWVERRLALRQYAAEELHRVPGGITAEEIAAVLDRPDLPEPFLPHGYFNRLGVSAVMSDPVALEVSVPYWWRPMQVVLVADLRLIEMDPGFAAAIRRIRPPRIRTSDLPTVWASGYP